MGLTSRRMEREKRLEELKKRREFLEFTLEHNTRTYITPLEEEIEKIRLEIDDVEYDDRPHWQRRQIRHDD